MVRESWKSRAGFIFAAAGSAVGLANIWRFPYVVGQYGGGAFILTYLVCLMVIGFPVFMSEVLVGRSTGMGAAGSFRAITGKRGWGPVGRGLVVTGFIVSSLYSVLAGWVIGYLFEAVRGSLRGLTTVGEALSAYEGWLGNPVWCVSFHLIFMILAVAVLIAGVRHGIERGTKLMMPLLILLLIALAVRGLLLPGSSAALSFIFRPDFSQLTTEAVLIALGQAFFTLSLGQGTMITYGSYLSGRENLPTTCFPVVLVDTGVSILASVAVLTIVFASGLPASTGPALMFETLPTVFARTPGGQIMSVAFFLLVAMAALTSQISAMEPVINYFVLEKGWKRAKAVVTCGGAAFLLGVPSALSFSLWKNVRISGRNFFELWDFVAIDLMIPLGGLIAVLFVGWVWGLDQAMARMRQGMEGWSERNRWFEPLFRVLVRYVSPSLIVLVFLNQLGLFRLVI
jgi:neurotransmitter:Na+ symporter, NSS family